MAYCRRCDRVLLGKGLYLAVGSEQSEQLFSDKCFLHMTHQPLKTGFLI